MEREALSFFSKGENKRKCLWQQQVGDGKTIKMFSWFGLLCCCRVQLLWQGDVALMGVRPMGGLRYDLVYVFTYLNDLYGDLESIRAAFFDSCTPPSLPPWRRFLSRLKLPSISEDLQFNSIKAP